MARSQKEERTRAANILGAFALALTDKMTAAVRAASDCSEMASAALVQIGCEPNISIERLRHCLALSHSATVRLVDGIEAAGLVRRQRGVDGDSRVASLTLTGAGQARVRRMLDARAAIVDGIVGALSREELVTVLDVMARTFPSIVESGADQDVVCRLCDLATCPQDECPVACRVESR